MRHLCVRRDCVVQVNFLVTFGIVHCMVIGCSAKDVEDWNSSYERRTPPCLPLSLAAGSSAPRLIRILSGRVYVAGGSRASAHIRPVYGLFVMGPGSLAV